MNDLVLTQHAGPVAILTLNRPARHNSLVPEFLAAIEAALTAVSAAPTARALLLQANGRSFSTGGDALGFVEHAADIEAYSLDVVGRLNRVILALLDLPVPVVTAVHGIVTGGALGFVLASDIVLLAAEASFTPFYSVVGPSPDGGWATLLPLLIGPRRAAEVLYLNQTIAAETAVAWGLANRVVPAAELRETARDVAQQIAAKQPGSIRRTRRLLHVGRADIAARLEAERQEFVAEMTTGAGLAGFETFLADLRARKQPA
ncbi:MAG: enoyl-CoA hydratase/isomerase family protein [Anaerolineales bacterium]|nr:enoyl-CoA hydratase/isomerase family protein [Anaerolineales bacterium]